MRDFIKVPPIPQSSWRRPEPFIGTGRTLQMFITRAIHLGFRAVSSVSEELEVITPSKLAIENVSKSFNGASGSVVALERVSPNVTEGEFVCLVGASGCGKSALLNITRWLEKPDSGTVSAEGIPVTGPGRERLVVCHEPAFVPW